jgi:hypothetical protein
MEGHGRSGKAGGGNGVGPLDVRDFLGGLGDFDVRTLER